MAEKSNSASLMTNGVPSDLWLGLLRDNLERDPVMARRAVLLSLLWMEAYQTRESLMARTERRLSAGCFGHASALTFRRDMQILKALLTTQGFELKYSRQTGRPGYYVAGRPELAPETLKAIRGAAHEADPRQIMAFAQMTPGRRASMALDLGDSVLSISVRRLSKARPDLNPWEAKREVLHHYYKLLG